MSDSVGDCFTRLRNGAKARREFVEMPHSKLAENILHLLKDQGFIGSYEVVDLGARKKNLRATLRYGKNSEPVLEHIRRISKPGHRTYSKVPGDTKVRGGLGFQILSTSQGVMTDRQAHEKRVGGEVIGEVY